MPVMNHWKSSKLQITIHPVNPTISSYFFTQTRGVLLVGAQLLKKLTKKMLQRLVSVLILSVLFFYSRYYQDVESAAVPITPDAPMQGVLELTDVNWSKNRMLQKTSQKPMLVMFYDPTCPFCKELAPIYAQFCKAVSESLYGDAILLGKFNMRATAQMVLLAGRIGVRGYPSIYLFYPSADEFASVKQQQQQGEKKKFVEYAKQHNGYSI